jgi:excisionase family DNA binding protein
MRELRPLPRRRRPCTVGDGPPPAAAGLPRLLRVRIAERAEGGVTGKLYTYEQAREYLSVSASTLQRRIRNGGLRVLVDGGVRRIPAAELERYVAEHMTAAGLPAAASAAPAGVVVPEGVKLWDLQP